MNISIITAIGKNRELGKNNSLLWHLPKDMTHFKNVTTGHSVIMGRKTFESIGRALPNRRNIVVTKNTDYKNEAVEVAHSLEDALNLVKDEEEVFIIGGAQIYKEALPFAHKLYITKVDGTFDADTFFPEIDESKWHLVSKEEHKKDQTNPYDLVFEVLETKLTK